MDNTLPTLLWASSPLGGETLPWLPDKDTSERSWGPQQPWQYSESEVTITETVLGRGAFGEVRIARWRNINVAAKRLHDLNAENGSSIEDINRMNESFMQEMKLLAKLRHPNLVLFLGVCFNEKTRLPTTILTELMPSSLYTILEDMKVRLQLPDILDIAIDVTTGIDYLHCHSPPVIHRDISAKNILIGGNRAKITDLGQSKIYENSMQNRQTDMPGAMAYSAPEVLTGKYTDKIDVFSFGVLLIQMSTGDYPRIERRDNQLLKAKSDQPCLDRLQPDDRPSARMICDQLMALRGNDRYYPPSRRVTPQSDLGVIGRRWMTEQIDLKIKDTKFALEQTSRRLVAEEARWRNEAGRADLTSKSLKEIENALTSVTELFQNQKKRAEIAEYKVKELEGSVDTLKSEIKAKNITITQLSAIVEKNSEILKENESQIKSLRKYNDKNNSVIEELSRNIRQARDSESESIERERETRLMMDMNEEQAKELESRLEQALMRWKKEKESTFAQSVLSAKFRSQNGHLIDTNKRLQHEVDMINERLSKYEHLDGPDELQARLLDHTDDQAQTKAVIDELEKQKTNISQEKFQLQEQCRSFKTQLEENKIDIETLRQTMSDKDQSIMDLKASIEKLQTKLSDSEEIILRKGFEIRDLKREINKMLSKISKSEDRAIDVIEKVKKDTECEKYMHEHHHDGAGSTAVLLVNDTFLPDSFGAGVMGGVLHAHHDAHHDARGPLMVHFPHRSNQVGDETAAPVAQRNTNFNESFSLEALPDAAVTLTEPTSHFEKLDLTLEERLKADITAKQEVQHTVDLYGHLGLLKVLGESTSNEFILWRATRALRDLVQESEEARADVVRLKADELTLQVMQSFPKSPTVQGQCIRLLGVLSYGNDVVRRRVGEKRGVSLITHSMEYHMENETVQTHACTALTNFFHNNIDNRFRFIESSGVDIIVAVMERHIESVNIQRRACWALLTLVGTDELARRVSSSRAVTAVVAAMVSHRLDSSVQQFGCWAISNLALAGEDVKRKLRKNGGLEICRIAMESHPNDAEVIRQARNALGTLGVNSYSS